MHNARGNRHPDRLYSDEAGSESDVADSRPDLSVPQGSGQILQFRLRQRVPTPPSDDSVSGSRPDVFDDLAQYEEDDIHIDYRHRMLMNVIAVMVVAALIGAGVWIADTISDMEKTQDCLMKG